MEQAWELSVRDAVSRIAAGELTATALLESCLERIREREEAVGAWELIDEEGARARAAALDTSSSHGPLHGIPVAVKDIIDVAGLPTRCGSSLRGQQPASADAWVVQRLREAGAVPLGKSVTTEFAYFTPGKTRNPVDLARTPGGSSSGSAAAVADHMVPLGLASQTAGSTTRPAAYCGIAGLVATPGRFDTSGVAGLSHTLDSLGLLTRDVEDLGLVAEALLGIRRQPGPDAPPSLLVCHGDDFGDISQPMRDALGRSRDACARAGARVHALPSTAGLRRLPEAQSIVMAYEAARSLAGEAQTGALSKPLRQLLDEGAKIPRETCVHVLDDVRRTRSAVLNALDGYHAVLTVAAPGVAPEGMPTGDPLFSRPWQVLGLPSVTIPGHTDPQGLPLGIQVVGRPDCEGGLIAVARWVERLLR